MSVDCLTLLIGLVNEFEASSAEDFLFLLLETSV